jgi:hypothetical protein
MALAAVDPAARQPAAMPAMQAAAAAAAAAAPSHDSPREVAGEPEVVVAMVEFLALVTAGEGSRSAGA